MSEQEPIEPIEAAEPAEAPVADPAQEAAVAPAAEPAPGEVPLEGAEPGAAASRPPARRSRGAVVIGAMFVLLGAFFLVDEIWDDFEAWKYVWPTMLIIVGAAVLVRARR
jgi:hypothetical protein